MKKLITSIIIAATVVCAFAAKHELYLVGRVKDNLRKTDLIDARVLLYDSLGNVCDTLRANQGLTYRAGQIDTLSNFYMNVPKVDSTYIFDVICDGYNKLTVTYTLDHIGRRENYRNMPTIYLERAPQMLNEVSVTSTKIKFYNKGDTVVYNADAFQLAEGSMLDALIAQLPGVELNNDGQIKVNGQFVESLLLNGKEFLDGNNNLMLENIGAYTVKNIEVYEGQSNKAKLTHDVAAPKLLTMDVKLKKEYNMGWIINGQGGYGTGDRYIAKVFASWFNATTRLSFVGNANNLNDNRTPGRNDTWTPEKMPNGKKEYRMAGFNYNHENADGNLSANGSLTFRQTVNNVLTTTARTNFLPGGDTYDNSFSGNHNRETSVSTGHSFYHTVKDAFTYGGDLYGSYNHSKNSGSALSGTFDEEQEGITAEILDAIYSDGSDERLAHILNRAKTRSDGWSHNLSGNIQPYFSYKLPKTSDRLSINLTAGYDSRKEELWRDYQINYGANQEPADIRRQYIDNTPNHTLRLGGGIRYSAQPGDFYLSLGYDFLFKDQVKDSYMYALDRLEDMGVYGVVPAGYLGTLDPANSYTSRTIENRHSINPMAMFNKTFNDAWLTVRLQPEINLVHRHFDYWRNNRSYKLSTNNATLTISSIWTGMIECQFNKSGEGRGTRYRNSVRYSYRIEPKLPELADMVDVINDADPLNIYLGNPDLKVQTRHNHLFRWSYTPASHTFSNIFYLGYIHTDRNLTRGYTYDTSTGVRYNRMYNVSGNDRAAVTNELSWQFGAAKQFTLSSSTDASLGHSTDMIGINMQEPERTRVKNTTFTENFKLSWQLGKQMLQLRGDFTNRHTTSTQTGFNTLNANHFNYGITGIFKFPAGFGISTDFTCYTRRGYGVDYLDTTDPIWNARISYCPPRNSRWVFMIDGFDLLHKLSNVNYAVTASGRTVSYTNTLPRYVIFSLQYRLNIQPKKK